MLDQLQSLLGALHSFVHPSNTGSWSVSQYFYSIVSISDLTLPKSVDKFFQTLARVASSKEFSLAKSENNSGSGEEQTVRGVKKHWPGW
jgi:hypothetical protein